jgi:hypothetical protein
MFIIIETDDGLTIEPRPADMTAEDVAAQHGGLLADPGPYETYDEANDALLILEQEDFDESEAEGRV